MRTNKMKDWLERVGWTAIQALSAAVITVLTSNGISWQEGVKFVVIATVISAAKVIVAQNAGSTDDGAAIPGGIREKRPIQTLK